MSSPISPLSLADILDMFFKAPGTPHPSSSMSGFTSSLLEMASATAKALTVADQSNTFLLENGRLDGMGAFVRALNSEFAMPMRNAGVAMALLGVDKAEVLGEFRKWKEELGTIGLANAMESYFQDEEAEATGPVRAWSPTAWQKSALHTYAGGQYAEIFSSITTHVNFLKTLDTIQDSLFKFLMIELGRQEDCESIEDAVNRLDSGIDDLSLVKNDLEQLAQGAVPGYLKYEYSFNESGRVASPGKFEEESWVTLYFYDAYMNGDMGEFFDFSPSRNVSVYRAEADDDPVQTGILEPRTLYALEFSDQGFVTGHVISEKDLEKLQQEVEDGDEQDGQNPF